jgi:hypothetical protein
MACRDEFLANRVARAHRIGFQPARSYLRIVGDERLRAGDDVSQPVPVELEQLWGDQHAHALAVATRGVDAEPNQVRV